MVVHNEKSCTLGDAILNLLAESMCLGVVGLKLEQGLVELAGIVVVAKSEVSYRQIEQTLASPVWHFPVDFYEGL